ncbi:hypothetical protein CEXT_582901 [Caerostris extrusa]|uniref:Uncharacterized protein n=1 Tax=Caerostris extrusa TaxID=172846 RepID=A0AAV4XR75_CAEEX|nr:hypothetical protein CEXT_582901 [Caerostris extrusa]
MSMSSTDVSMSSTDVTMSCTDDGSRLTNDVWMLVRLEAVEPMSMNRCCLFVHDGLFTNSLGDGDYGIDGTMGKTNTLADTMTISVANTMTVSVANTMTITVTDSESNTMSVGDVSSFTNSDAIVVDLFPSGLGLGRVLWQRLQGRRTGGWGLHGQWGAGATRSGPTYI